ncbi:MAG: pyrroline-5-carboxylate reductase [Clostridiales bacterium]|nr:pyrroline-5-carboxylate reductase [Clostridiales bacterium]
MTSIGFVGSGMMAEAVVSGMLKGGFAPEDIRGADPDGKRREHMEKTYGIRCTADNGELAGACEVLVMAVKPQYFAGAAEALRPGLRPSHRVISIMAGVTTAQLESALQPGRGGALPVVRVMPNTPAMVGAGVTCLCAGSKAGERDVEFAKKIFETVGAVIPLEERLIDAATGVAGCGPAYVYMIIEAMADGGAMMGLPRQVAQKLAAEAVRGAAEMVLAGQGHPGQLKDGVCSPGGATIEGVYALEKAGLRGAMMEAVKAGAEKCANI